MSIYALLNSWKIRFRDTKFRYCSSSCCTFSSRPYFTVHPRNLVSVRCRNAIRQHLCSRNFSLTLRWAALGPIVSNRRVIFSSCSSGTSLTLWDIFAVWNLVWMAGRSAKKTLCSSSFLLIILAVSSFIIVGISSEAIRASARPSHSPTWPRSPGSPESSSHSQWWSCASSLVHSLSISRHDSTVMLTILCDSITLFSFPYTCAFSFTSPLNAA